MKTMRTRLDGDMVTIYTENEKVARKFETDGYQTIREGSGWFCAIDMSEIRKMKEE